MKKPMVDLDLCIGCNECGEVCPEVFELKEEKAYVIASDKCDTRKCEQTADLCPVQAISIVEE